jgi:uncharacterized protein YpmS
VAKKFIKTIWIFFCLIEFKILQIIKIILVKYAISPKEKGTFFKKKAQKLKKTG